jgi:hypothetical protein
MYPATSSGLAWAGVRLVMQCDLLGGALSVQAADVATDPEDLGAVGEADRGLGGDGSDAGGALFSASVPTLERDVLGREVAGRAGQRLLAGGQQARLVPFDRELLPRRRPRANPRVVKREYTKWHVKRSRHREWPQPNGLHLKKPW